MKAKVFVTMVEGVWWEFHGSAVQVEVKISSLLFQGLAAFLYAFSFLYGKEEGIAQPLVIRF